MLHLLKNQKKNEFGTFWPNWFNLPDSKGFSFFPFTFFKKNLCNNFFNNLLQIISQLFLEKMKYLILLHWAYWADWAKLIKNIFVFV